NGIYSQIFEPLPKNRRQRYAKSAFIDGQGILHTYQGHWQGL
ncbi:unnamed protein product, partial [marine sediment metagenome]